MADMPKWLTENSVDDRNLRIITGAALTEAITDIASQLPASTTFALIATLWKSLPAEAVDGLVHHAAVKVGVVDRREVFASYHAEHEVSS